MKSCYVRLTQKSVFNQNVVRIKHIKGENSYVKEKCVLKMYFLYVLQKTIFTERRVCLTFFLFLKKENMCYCISNKVRK